MSKYYDLEDILAEAERFPCKPNNADVDLAELIGQPASLSTGSSARSDLPLWFARPLAQEQILNFPELPKCLSNSSLESLKTTPESVQLSLWTPTYFHLVGWVLDTIASPDMKLRDICQNAMLVRLARIFECVLTSQVHQVLNDKRMQILLDGLDAFERRVYMDAVTQFIETESWFRGKNQVRLTSTHATRFKH
jgi:hypothetical protein